MDEKVASTSFSKDSMNVLLRNTKELSDAFNKACQDLSDTENLKADSVLRIDNQDINEESQIFKVSTEKFEEIFHSEVFQAETNKTMDQRITDESKCAFGANSTGTNTDVDFEEVFKKCTSEFDREIYQSTENTNLKINLADSRSEDKNVNLKYMPVSGVEIISLVEASTSELSKEGHKIKNQNTDDINVKDNSEAFHTSSSGETGGKKDLEVDNLVLNLEASTGNMAKATGGNNTVDLLEGVLKQGESQETDDVEDILKEFSAEINKIDDFEAILKECSTEINEMMDQTDENSDLNLNVSNNFDSSFEKGRENRNLAVKPVVNTENIEIMDQTNQSISNARNFKSVTILNTVKDDETPNIDKNSTTDIQTTDSSDNIEYMNAEVKQFKVNSDLKRKSRKRKIPPVSEMVMASIKKIKRNDGASFEDIKKQMEENYPVKVQALLKYHVSKFLSRVVDKGFLEKIDGIDTVRYAIKENEIIKK